jgi:hypothetical protein
MTIMDLEHEKCLFPEESSTESEIICDKYIKM